MFIFQWTSPLRMLQLSFSVSFTRNEDKFLLVVAVFFKPPWFQLWTLEVHRMKFYLAALICIATLPIPARCEVYFKLATPSKSIENTTLLQWDSVTYLIWRENLLLTNVVVASIRFKKGAYRYKRGLPTNVAAIARIVQFLSKEDSIVIANFKFAFRARKVCNVASTIPFMVEFGRLPKRERRVCQK